MKSIFANPQPTSTTMNSPLHLAARFGAIVSLACVLAAGTPAARAADGNPPNRISYQGYLVDANGVPLGNTAPKNYDVVFRLYDAQAQGTGNRLWSEQQTVTLDKGYFSVQLGEGGDVAGESRPALATVFTGATASDRFVETTVKGIGSGGADVTIQPRLRLLTAPYAFTARNLGSPSGTLLSVSNNNIGIGTTTPLLTLDVRGPIGLENTIGNGTARPAFTNSPLPGEISGLGTGGGATPWLGAADGFLRLSAGSMGAKSFIDLSGYSTIPDMDRNIVFGTAGIERMRINPTGKIGIGTASPDLALTVAGDIGLGVSTADYRMFRVGGGNSFGYLYGSFLGLSDGIHLGYNYYYDAGGAGRCFNAAGPTSRLTLGYGNISLGTGEPNTPPTTRLSVTQGGNVGIGTTNPDRKLSVEGDISIADAPWKYRHLRLGGGNAYGYVYGSYHGLGDGLQLSYNCFYDANGAPSVNNVNGAGTSRLTVGYGSIVLATGGQNSMPANRMQVNSSGHVCMYNNVGIGPAYWNNTPSRLNVDGSIEITGNYWMKYGGNYYCLQWYGGGAPDWNFDGAEWWGPGVGYSDQRLKTNIITLPSALDKLMRLRAVEFNWNEMATERFTKNIPNSVRSGSNDPEETRKIQEEALQKARTRLAKQQIGFLANEVEQVFPDWVSNDSDGFKKIDMKPLNAVLVNAIKEQQDQIQAQGNEVTTLKRENEELRRRVDKLEALVKSLVEHAGNR